MVGDFQETSELKKKYGYSVAKGEGEAKRRSKLRRAQSEMGLHMVVFTISGFVRLRKLIKNRNFEDSIEKWEADLEWLKSTYYDGHGELWPWPEY